MTGKTLLRPGDSFPGLIVNLPGGRTVDLPGDLAGWFGVVLDPGGQVIVSVYSSGAIGRLVPQDVIGLIRYVRGTQLSRQEAPHGTATS
jgi:hypothetical protein